MRLAFGTFIGLPDPSSWRTDADYVGTRWRADPAAAFGAEIGGDVAGSADKDGVSRVNRSNRSNTFYSETANSSDIVNIFRAQPTWVHLAPGFSLLRRAGRLLLIANLSRFRFPVD